MQPAIPNPSGASQNRRDNSAPASRGLVASLPTLTLQAIPIPNPSGTSQNGADLSFDQATAGNVEGASSQQNRRDNSAPSQSINDFNIGYFRDDVSREVSRRVERGDMSADEAEQVNEVLRRNGRILARKNGTNCHDEARMFNRRSSGR